MDTSKVTVAVIGAGPTGLAVLKNLRENGFSTTLYERRSQVGGIWAYSEDKEMTTALPFTTANISKYACGLSDFPMPDKYPHYLSQSNFQEFLEDYAKHFNLLDHIVLNTTVKCMTRNETDSRWRLQIENSGKASVVEFDKVALCHGYQSIALMPKFEGRDSFFGTVIHSQEYRGPEQFKGQKVVVVGLGPTAGDIIPNIMPHASKVFVSHRRGVPIFKRWRDGTPADLGITRHRRRIIAALSYFFPSAFRKLVDTVVPLVMKKTWGELDPAWRLTPFPSVTLRLPSSAEEVMPYLKDGSLSSLGGLQRFVGPRAIEFDDGTVVEDVDAVICCTGYAADFSITPFVEQSRPANYNGTPIVRLYKNLFPPEYADSVCIATYSAFGRNNGFSIADVIGMAISNIWRGAHSLPSKTEMEADIDTHQAWVASYWRLDERVDVSMVRQWEWQNFLHEAAGTGMENLGWGWKGWLFWIKDPKLSYLMNNGVDTAHTYRFFETGKRKTWPGARDAILRVNAAVKIFPLKNTSFKEHGYST